MLQLCSNCEWHKDGCVTGEYDRARRPNVLKGTEQTPGRPSQLDILMAKVFVL